MKLSFIDAGVLIAAARGTEEVSERALDILDDSERRLVSSEYVRLEVLPKAVYNGYMAEAEFYREFFERVERFTRSSSNLAEEALHIACTLGLSACDALHVAAAQHEGVDELVTKEKTGKPLHRATSLMEVISIHPSLEEDT